MLYFFLKTLHVLSSTILFGTGIGSAFYLLRANQSKNITNMLFATRNVVLADWIFTTPAVILQPITGFWIIYLVGYPLSMFWIWMSLLLYIAIGACWIPVVYIQIKLQQLLEHAVVMNTPLPEHYYKLYRTWFILGWPAFGGVITIFFLMVYKIS